MVLGVAAFFFVDANTGVDVGVYVGALVGVYVGALVGVDVGADSAITWTIEEKGQAM